MYKENESGFTLIELIMVMVIMGVLAAVIFPRFYDFTQEAHDANESAVIGAIKSSLELYAANQLIDGNSWTYPDGDDFEVTPFLGIILNEIPDKWSVEIGANKAGTDAAHFVYNPDGTNFDLYYTYSYTPGTSLDYTLTGPTSGTP